MKKILSVFLFIAMICGCIGIQYESVLAVSKNLKIKKIYAEILTDKSDANTLVNLNWGSGKDCKFGLIDINKDGVQELIFTPDDGYHVNVLAYVNGKVKNVGWGFAGTQAYYPNKKIYYSETSHDTYERNYYKFDGKKMISKAHLAGTIRGEQTYKYYIGKKKVSKSRYNSYVEKMLNGAKEVKLKWYANSSKNRKKITVRF